MEYGSDKFPFKLRNNGGLASNSEPRSNESDKCIYYKFVNDVCTVICLYVDDLLILAQIFML